MAQLLVRNLDDAVKEQLRAQARRHGRSMEEEVRVIIGKSMKTDSPPGPKNLGTWLLEQRAREKAAGFTVSDEDMEEFNKYLEEARKQPWGPGVDFTDDHSGH